MVTLGRTVQLVLVPYVEFSSKMNGEMVTFILNFI